MRAQAASATAPLFVADGHHEIRRNLVEEPARRAVVGRAEQHAAPRMTEVQPLLGAGEADVAKAALFLELVRVADAAHVWEDAVLHADDEHDGELETFRRMQRHQRDRALVGIRLVEVGDE